MFLLLLAGWPASVLAADDGPVVQDVLDILKERGLVDEDQYTELVAKNQVYEEEQEGLLGRIEWSGNMRMRLESFWFDEDANGIELENRTRLRYRLRLKGEATINDYFDAVFQIASGEGGNRSTNRTFGKDDDFSVDDIFIDQAYMKIHLPTRIEGFKLDSWVGKMKNPFVWKGGGTDFIMWDHDINPEGIALVGSYPIYERTQLIANAGYFIIDENSQSSDPHLLGIQAGIRSQAIQNWDLGARFSWYSLGSLNEAFFDRARDLGAIIPGSWDSGSPNFIELHAYARFLGFERWPVVAYAHFTRNLDAQKFFPGAGKNDTGYVFGIEIGDKKNFAQFTLGWYHLEANFWVPMFTDSDILDGVTNRQGLLLRAFKQILPNTTAGFTVFVSDEIADTPFFFETLTGSDRTRFQADLEVKF